MEFYESKVKYERKSNSGKVEKTSEIYLIEAVSFSDAEQHVLKEIEPFILPGQEVEVKSIRKMVVHELMPNDQGHFWYKAKICFTTIDEEAGKERNVTQTWLVQEVDMESAYKIVNESMKESISDYTIKTLQETGIVSVIRV